MNPANDRQYTSCSTTGESSLQMRRVYRVSRHILSLLQDRDKPHVEAFCARNTNRQRLISLQRHKTCSRYQSAIRGILILRTQQKRTDLGSCRPCLLPSATRSPIGPGSLPVSGGRALLGRLVLRNDSGLSSPHCLV